MSYLFITITGILAILGVLLETHKEIDRGEKKVKVITPWGIITCICLAITLSMSLYLQYESETEAEKLQKDNEFMKLSLVPVGPYYYFRIHFKDSLFTPKNRLEELKYAKKQYSAGFLDSNSRNHVFKNMEYIMSPNSPVAQINLNAGVLSGRITFDKDGRTSPVFNSSKPISRFFTNHEDTTKNAIEARFFYVEDTWNVGGQLQSELKAGTIYGAILKEYEKSSSAFYLYFDKEPSSVILNKCNAYLNQVDRLEFQLAYDPDAFYWLKIKFRLSTNYSLQTPHKDLKQWVMIKKIEYDGLPAMGDISK
ncbi:hypothetical protein [Chitinophaga sp.]|uniref:hypothetical protein n=1 Tax=Chitinophaga sp. TaxID=1869181 RepID=UPI002F945B0C